MEKALKRLQIFWLFYRKIFFPVALVSILAGSINASMMGIEGLAKTGNVLIFLTPVFQLVIYDIFKPNEYYFYNNLGFSRTGLWISTFSVSLLIGFTIILVL